MTKHSAKMDTYAKLTQQMCDFLRHSVIRQRGLVRVPLLFELHRTKQENSGHYSEYRVEVFIVHAHNIHRLYCSLEFCRVVDSWDW